MQNVGFLMTRLKCSCVIVDGYVSHTKVYERGSTLYGHISMMFLSFYEICVNFCIAIGKYDLVGDSGDNKYPVIATSSICNYFDFKKM